MCRPRSSSDRLARLGALACLFVAAVPVCLAASRLTAQPSPFLQAQAASPVDWSPWNADALARAKAEKKPVFLAISMFNSELGRAMARQSFANAETAKFLNDQFVCVLVDGKERPDLAALYQNYLQAVKQMSGPPMNIWLTPDLKPFEGANYLPPTEEWGKEGFVTVSKRVATAWRADANAQNRKADEAVTTVKAAQPSGPPEPVPAASVAPLLSDAIATWQARFDAANGGFGEAPKYAEPELLRALLASPASREMAVTTLHHLVRSPVRDVLDGGFFRYSADPTWHQPYFQKLMIDQPRLALALLDAAKATDDAEFREAARGALRCALTQMAAGGGEYAAVLDSTGEDLTPSYLWTMDEIRSALGEKPAAEFAEAFGVTAAGNIPDDSLPGISAKGKNLLFRNASPASSSAEAVLATSAAKLLKVRATRPAPRRDDAAVSGAHGLMLAALARAGAELHDAELAAAAKAEAAFIQQRLVAKDGMLRRMSGREIEATPADYALVIDGLLTFAGVTSDTKARQLAGELVAGVNARYWDATTGRFFATPATQDPAFWARVYSPAPGAGDPPTAEPAMLHALRSHSFSDKGLTAQADKLLSALAADAKTAADPVRGDVLLALQAVVGAQK